MSGVILPGNSFDEDLARARSHAADANRSGPGQPTDWGRLMRGQTVGKRIIVIAKAGIVGTTTIPSAVNMLTVQGSDNEALNLGLTLHEPQVVPIAGLTLPDNLQNISGEQDNAQIAGSNPAFKWDHPQAIVEWGIGGVSGKVVVDFMNGCLLNLMASWVRVSAQIDDFGPGSDAAYVLRSQLGPSHAAPTRAQNMVRVGAVNFGATSVPLPTPSYAKDLIPYLTGAGDPDFEVLFFKDALGATQVGRFIYTSAASNNYRYGEACPVPGDGYYFAIKNTQAAVESSYRALFGMVL